MISLSMIRSRKSPIMWAAAVFSGAALVSSASSSQELTLTAAAEPSPEKIRRYDQGPLTLEDFLGSEGAGNTASSDSGKPANIKASQEKKKLIKKKLIKKGSGQKLFAYTMTDIQYEFKYRKRKSGKKVVLSLTKIDVFAVVLRERSWNNRKWDKPLLAHEQGHFDLTHARSLQADLALNKMFDKKQLTPVRAKTEKEAAQKMAKKIEESLRPIFERLSEDHKNYDKLTYHGLQKKSQAEQRDLHRQQIQYFTDKLAEYESSR